MLDCGVRSGTESSSICSSEAGCKVDNGGSGRSGFTASSTAGSPGEAEAFATGLSFVTGFLFNGGTTRSATAPGCGIIPVDLNVFHSALVSRRITAEWGVLSVLLALRVNNSSSCRTRTRNRWLICLANRGWTVTFGAERLGSSVKRQRYVSGNSRCLLLCASCSKASFQQRTYVPLPDLRGLYL